MSYKPSILGDTTLKPKQIRVLACIASGLTYSEAAQVARCTRQAIDKWMKLPHFVAELRRLLDLQRDYTQAMVAQAVERGRQVIFDAQNATDGDGQPDHAVRLRATELVVGAYERLSKRPEVLAPPPSGPLIVLPAGSSRMALVIEQAPQSAELPPAAPIEVQATAPDPPKPAPAAAALPRWWRGPTSRAR